MPEIESLASLDAQLATAGTLAECYVQSLDLTGRSDRLLSHNLRAGIEFLQSARGAEQE